jgi:hypothetical protein
MQPAGPEEAPEVIADAAKACVRFVQDALSLELDFTPDTLPILDHYVRTRAVVGQAGEEVRDLLTPALGAYFGEVVRRGLPSARWHVPDDLDDFPSYRLEFDSIFLHFNPLGVAREVLEQDDVDGFGVTFQVLDEARATLEDALQQGGEVSAEDYYSFTVRHETLEQVVSVLTALELQHASPDRTPRRFGPEVYRAAAGETLARGGRLD